MHSPDGAVLYACLTILLAILILVLGIGMLAWARMKKEDREAAVRLAKREETRKRIALHGAQLGDVIVDDVSLEDMQGSWEMVSVGRNGNFAPPEVLQNASVGFVVSGARFFIEATNGTGTLKVDRSFSPVHLDQCDDDGDTHLCIVRLRNGELEICQGETGSPRPETFDPNRHDNASLTRFKRVT